MSEKFRSKWMDVFSDTSKGGTDKTDKRGSKGASVSFVSGHPTYIQKTAPPINPTDKSTWPPYLQRLWDESLETGGRHLAERQLRAELAFWSTAEAEGWTLLEVGLNEKESHHLSPDVQKPKKENIR